MVSGRNRLQALKLGQSILVAGSRNQVTHLHNATERSKTFYREGFWDEGKVPHRRWVIDMVRRHSTLILDRNGHLKSVLKFASLPGAFCAETKWYMENDRFFEPSQLLAIDYNASIGSGFIDPQTASEIGIPSSNIFTDKALIYQLRSLQAIHSIAIINADTTRSLTESCIRNDLAFLVDNLKYCAEKVGEAFLFFNVIYDIARSKVILPQAERLYGDLESGKLVRQLFHPNDFPGKNIEDILLREHLTYRGHSSGTQMLCFCMRLVK